MNTLLEKLSKKEMSYIKGGEWILSEDSTWIWVDCIAKEKNSFDKMQNDSINEDYLVGKGAR